MEFQPVIMAAGRGSRMVDLTANTPKPLLPIGNRPMILYPVHLLAKAGFESAIVITLESMRGDLIQALQSVGDIKIDVVTIPSDEDWGTADSLRHIAHKIKTDILVISCDVITDLEIHILADVHRAHNATVTAFLHSASEPSSEGLPVPGTKSKRKGEQKDIIGLDVSEKRLMLMTAEADIEESLSIRTSLLQRYPHIKVRTNLLDAHVYIMKRWVLDFLTETKKGKSLTTLKGEVLPYLVKQQFKKVKKDVEDDSSLINETNQEQPDIFSFVPKDDLYSFASKLSSRHNAGQRSQRCQEDKLRCFVSLSSDFFCIRANTTASYCEANRLIASKSHLLENEALIHPSVTIKSKPQQVGSDSMIGEGSAIGDKISIKKSIIGKHCTIADRVKIVNSVIMDHVTIQEGCTIQGSVICGNAHINKDVELKDCIVGSSQSVPEKTKLSNDVFGDADRMMKI